MKKVFVFWSGGLDSTYAIQRYIDCGYWVTAGYVNFVYNEQTKAELAAIDKMLPILNMKYKGKFDYIGEIARVGFMSMVRRQQFHFLLTIASGISGYDGIEMSVVSGDTNLSYLGEMQSTYKALRDDLSLNNSGGCPLWNLLSKTDKVSILGWIDTDLLPHIHYCSNPKYGKKKTIPCGVCDSCLRHEMELKRKKQWDKITKGA
jgi:7-cyano-7-deazaguanine synthase in queuosine biosynthesis